jgi:hypothetical protein
MQCVQCWNEIKREDIKCDVCNEMFCSYKCLNNHSIEVIDGFRQQSIDSEFEAEQLDYQDKYREPNEPFGRYPWEK